MPLSPVWFEPCSECETPEECERVRDCTLGYDCEHAEGFDFTQESEDRYNDPRRR